MNLVRRLLLGLAGIALTLALTYADASAAPPHRSHYKLRRHHVARLTTATYHVPARPHVPRRLRAANPADSRFAQTPRHSLMTGS